jgi:hypothetical protein
MTSFYEFVNHAIQGRYECIIHSKSVTTTGSSQGLVTLFCNQERRATAYCYPDLKLRNDFVVAIIFPTSNPYPAHLQSTTLGIAFCFMLPVPVL